MKDPKEDWKVWKMILMESKLNWDDGDKREERSDKERPEGRSEQRRQGERREGAELEAVRVLMLCSFLK